MGNVTNRDQSARHLFLAVSGGRRVRVRYWSVNREKATLRELRPHAFGHDGCRWHLRAWCHDREDFRDFVIHEFDA